MTTDILKAIKDILHELQPLFEIALLLVTGYIARQAKSGKEYSKKAVVEAVTAGRKADIAVAVSQENQVKLDEVHKAVNGRMDQQIIATSEVARREGYDQGSADTLAMQKVSEE